MKILLINTVPTDKNGITNVLFNYLGAMDTRGIQTDLVSINQPDDFYVTEVEKRGGRVYVLQRHNGLLLYWKSLRSLIRRNQYDIVHIHGNSHTTVLELSAAKAAGCGVRIVHAHNTTCMHLIVHKVLAIFFNALYTHGVACGEEAGEFMFGSHPFKVINNGVDTSRFAFNPEHRNTLREKYNWHECMVIGHVGYFSVVKNQRWLIEVFRELLNMDDRWRLLLMGDGDLRDEIVEKVKEYRIEDRVVLTGNVNNVDEYLSALDLVLMPSLYEGLPLTLIEQQANGLKCVVADTITTEADKTNNLIFLSLSASAQEWAKEISRVKLLNNSERIQMSARAIDLIKKCGYSIVEESQKLKNFYFEILKKSIA